MVVSHTRRHTRDKINTVLAAVYVVSHVGAVYTRRVESAKAIHSILRLSFRQSDLDESFSPRAKRKGRRVVRAREKRMVPLRSNVDPE